MASLGARRIWIPFDSAVPQIDEQILQREGYITIKLHGAYYSDIPNWWQKHLGGKDSVTLRTFVTYKNASEVIESSSIENILNLKANNGHFISKER